MDITPLVAQDSQIIQSYAHGRFTISGKNYDGPVLVRQDGVESWQGLSEDNVLESFSCVLNSSEPIDVVLLGCGKKASTLDSLILKAFSEKGIMIEAMDTGAACRTYNVLMAEGRQILALLQPI